MSAPILVVAGVASGVGKTTVTLGLLAAYRRRGLRVQAFKVGPDFIDAGLQAVVTGRPSYNLDGWMCGREDVVATVARHAADADLAIIEGVMGCFDGFDATGEDGSTAQVAKWLDAPVALVIDAAAQARSAAAVVHGFERFDPALRLEAVIANHVGGAGHAALIRDAVAATCRAAVVGAIAADAALALPERHLGLVTAAEGVLTPALGERLAQVVERSIDLDRLLALARPPAVPDGSGPPQHGPGAGRSAPGRATIAVAHDAAFQFYYEDNLDRLRAAGAELVFWSPLRDRVPGADGLYLGGGYPELHARALAANAEALAGVRALAAAGAAIYAECGGLMYLAESLDDMEGVARPMVGLLPARVRMTPRRLTLGYTEVRFERDTPLGASGAVARGHEFHASTLEAVPASVPRAYALRGRRGEERAEGYLIGNALVSYVHLHFASNPALAEAFVGSCVGARR